MSYLIAMVVGALFGAVGDGPFGALVGAAIGWLVASALRQQQQLAALHARVASLAGLPGETPLPDRLPAVPGLSAGAVESATGPIEAPVNEPVGPAPAVPAPVGFAPVGLAPVGLEPSEAGPATDMMAAPAIPVEAPRPPRPDPLGPLRRWLTGGNTIAKVGVLILIVGLALLAKYATEHSHLSPEVRLAGIGVVAIVLLAVGWRLRLSRPGYGQILQGGAVAVLYLTLFVAFRYFGVLAALPALTMMVAVAALAAALAVLQDARALAVIGALGGFATPLIVSTGSNNANALFAYYFILDAGIAAVAWSKTWRPLNLVGFFATFAVAGAWGIELYRPDAFLTSEAFLAAFFLLFVLIMLLPARRLSAAVPASAATTWVNSSLLFGLPTVVFALQYGLVKDSAWGPALSALVLAGVYVALASWMRRRPQLGITFDATLAIATVFLTLVVPFALDPRSTAGAWTLEGAGLVWIGFRQGRLLPRAFGYALHLAAACAMVFGHDRFGAPHGVFNAYLFSGLMAAGAAIASAWFVHRAVPAGRAKEGEALLQPCLIALATLWLIVTAGIEIDRFVAGRFALAASLVAVSAIALLYAVLGGRLAWRAISVPAMAHAPLLLLVAAIDAAFVDDPLGDGGAWAWPVAFLVHLAVLRLVAPAWPATARRAAHTLGVLALALLGALIGRSVTAGWGDADSAWPWLGWLAAPALLMLLLPRPGTATVWPVRDAPEAYVRHAGAALAAALLIWTLLANIASDGSAAPLPPLPLLNPLDLGVALALAAVLLWWRSRSARSGVWLAALSLAGFVWLNAMLVRGFHHYGDVPYRFDAWVGSFAVQAGITLLWTATALVAMWLATRRRARLPWVVGAVLLGAVVLKLVLVDLAGAGTVARIVSFIGVGVLMLVIGYVAPLPTREVRHAV